MEFGALAQLIKDSLQKNLPLDTAKLQSTPITQISNDVFPGNLIRLDVSGEKDAYEEDAENQRVIVRGKGVDLPFTGLDSEIQFYLEGNEAALTWTATGNSQWTMGKAFPQLQKTICDELRFSNAPPPRIVLNSHNEPPDNHQGMFFAATIDLNAMTAGLAGVLGIANLQISGPIVLKDHGSTLQEVDFIAPVIKSINLGIAHVSDLSFAIKSQFIFNPLRKTSFIAPYILLSTEIPFKSQGENRPIPVSVRLVDLESDVRFSADPTHLIDAGLDELESLTNGVSLKKFKLPDKFHIEDVIKFSDFFFDFNLQTKKVTQVCVGVESAHPWPILHLNASQQDLILEQIGLTFRLLDPFGAKLPSLTLTGELEFGKADKDPGVLILTATYPDWSIQGYLKEGTELDLAETLPPFLGSTAPVEKLAIDVFDFELSRGNYAISLDIKGDWDIPIGSTGVGLGLEQLQFSISYQTGAGTDAFVEGRFRIATLDIDVSAKHPASATEGWTFTGSVTAETGISISRLFAGTLDARFPSGTLSAVPPMLDLSIKSLKADFNTQSRDFHFDTEIDLGPNVKTVLTFAKLRQDGATPPTFEKRATGVITVFPGKPDEVAFALGIDLKPDSKHFVALYDNPANTPVNLGNLVKAMFPSVGSLPLPNFGITIKDGVVGYVSEKQGDTTVSQSVFALDMDASLDLSRLGDIPLIGKTLSAAKSLTLAFQLVYAPKPVATTDLVELNKLITVAGPQFPTDQPLSGVSVKTELRIGANAPIDFKLPVTITSNGQLQSNNGQQFTPPPGSQPTDDGVKWFQLNEQFGPVHLQRAGFKFENGEITALLDGGLTALGLEVDLMGLSVSSKITDVEHGQFKPEFGLPGLGLSFSKGGVGFTGALLHLKDEYDGLANVEAEGLRLAAIGSLREVNNQTSLFLYAILDYALGGSPFFYVTGLAGGFGLNQKLIMPAVDQVNTFPLIQAALNPPKVPTDPGSAGTFINAEMQSLHNSLNPGIGQYFGCAGVHFTSFELLDSFILVSISFGREFELDLVGVSTLVVPPQLPESEPPIAKVSLQVVGSFIPNEGIAIVQGRLTADSHILDPDCHLTGGFAFATWFGSNPHAGDFVITLGGYHPDFQKPAHYPTVPRIGVNWKVSTELSVSGGIYFALTPRALMAGGAMHAVFQTSLDLTIATVDVKAWFILGADFIVYWKPFHYSAGLYIDIGIDVVIHFLGTHELSFEAGADLEVWGPRFGGHAHVFVKVIGIKIGFDVKFGASAPKPLPLDWDNEDKSKSFKQSFLPGDDKIVSVAISEGLVRKVDVASKQASSNTEDIRYVINPKDFRVRTSSVIPIKNITSDIKPGQDLAGNKSFGIAPMAKGASNVDTFHQIKVTRNNLPTDSSFLLLPIKSNVPGGLWAEENTQDVNAPGLIENALVGFEIVPAKRSVPGHTKSIPREKLAYTTHPVANAYKDDTIHTFSATVPSPGDDPVANNNLWNRIQKEIHTNTTRDQILSNLGFAKADIDIGEPFTTDAAYAPSYGELNS